MLSAMNHKTTLEFLKQITIKGSNMDREKSECKESKREQSLQLMGEESGSY